MSINKHKALKESMKILGIEAHDISLKILDNEYIKIIGKEKLRHRSPSEIIFKPFFIKKIEEYFGRETTLELLYRMATNTHPERILHFALVNYKKSN